TTKMRADRRKDTELSSRFFSDINDFFRDRLAPAVQLLHCDGALDRSGYRSEIRDRSDVRPLCFGRRSGQRVKRKANQRNSQSGAHPRRAETHKPNDIGAAAGFTLRRRDINFTAAHVESFYTLTSLGFEYTRPVAGSGPHPESFQT